MRISWFVLPLTEAIPGRDLTQGMAHVSTDGAQGLLRTAATNGTESDQDLRCQPRPDAERGRPTRVRLQVHEQGVQR